jgi:hypothetical protein
VGEREQTLPWIGRGLLAEDWDEVAASEYDDVLRGGDPDGAENPQDQRLGILEQKAAELRHLLAPGSAGRFVTPRFGGKFTPSLAGEPGTAFADLSNRKDLPVAGQTRHFVPDFAG